MGKLTDTSPLDITLFSATKPTKDGGHVHALRIELFNTPCGLDEEEFARDVVAFFAQYFDATPGEHITLVTKH